MSIVNTLSLESNRQIKINFDGGDLSSDAGLLLIKEFEDIFHHAPALSSYIIKGDSFFRFSLPAFFQSVVYRRECDFFATYNLKTHSIT